MPLLSSLGLKIKKGPKKRPLSWALKGGIGRAGYASMADDTDGHTYVVSYDRVARLNQYGDQVWANIYDGIPNMYNMVMDDSKIYCVAGSGTDSPAALLILNKSDGSVVYAGEFSGSTYNLYGDRAISIDIENQKLFIGGMWSGTSGGNRPPALARLDISSSTPFVEDSVYISSIDYSGDFGAYDIEYNPNNKLLYVAAWDYSPNGIVFFATETSGNMKTNDAVGIKGNSSTDFLFNPMLAYNEYVPSVISFSFMLRPAYAENSRQIWGAFNDTLDQSFSSESPRYIVSYRDEIIAFGPGLFHSIAIDKGFPISFHGRLAMVKTQPSSGTNITNSLIIFGTDNLAILPFEIKCSSGGIVTGNGNDVIRVEDYDSSTVGYVDNNSNFDTFYENNNATIPYQDYSGRMSIDRNQSISQNYYTQNLTTISVSATPYQITSDKWTIFSS